MLCVWCVACGMFSLLSRENKTVFATWVHRCYIYIMTTRLFYNNIVNNTPWKNRTNVLNSK